MFKCMCECTAAAPCEKHRRWTPSGAFFMMELKDCLKSGTCFHSGCRLNRSSYKSITVTSVPGCTWEVQRNWSGSKKFSLLIQRSGTERETSAVIKLQTGAQMQNSEIKTDPEEMKITKEQKSLTWNHSLIFTSLFLSDMLSSPISF